MLMLSHSTFIDLCKHRLRHINPESHCSIYISNITLLLFTCLFICLIFTKNFYRSQFNCTITAFRKLNFFQFGHYLRFHYDINHIYFCRTYKYDLRSDCDQYTRAGQKVSGMVLFKNNKKHCCIYVLVPVHSSYSLLSIDKILSVFSTIVFLLFCLETSRK